MRSQFTRSFTQLSAAAALLALVTPTAFAQDLNIDIATLTGTPTNAYGGAAAQPGTWNTLVSATGPYSGLNLLNTAGVATTADVSNTGGFGDFNFNNGGTLGDDQALMDDCQDVGGVGGTTTWTFSQLTNGTYNVYTYSWAPDSGTFLSNVTVPGSSSTNPQLVGGNWPGVQTQGVTFAKHTVVVAAGSLSVTIATVSGFASVNGFQLDLQAGPAISSFCLGDGTGTPCPCGNSGSAGRGCKNSKVSAPFGALLTAVNGLGNPSPSVSVTANDLGLKAENMMAGSYTIFFQGTTSLGAGNVSPFYDGLECVGGTVLRLGRITTMGGTNTLAGVAGVAGLAAAAQTRHYQAAYRNSVNFCTPATLNTSNALTVNWTP
jgi:hypothetical protein